MSSQGSIAWSMLPSKCLFWQSFSCYPSVAFASRFRSRSTVQQAQGYLSYQNSQSAPGWPQFNPRDWLQSGSVAPQRQVMSDCVSSQARYIWRHIGVLKEAARRSDVFVDASLSQQSLAVERFPSSLWLHRALLCMIKVLSRKRL
jgi:hypothetical protein